MSAYWNEVEGLRDESHDMIRALSNDEIEGVTGGIGWAFLGKIIADLSGSSSGRGSSGDW